MKGVLVNYKVNMIQPCDTAAKKVNVILGWINRCIKSGMENNCPIIFCPGQILLKVLCPILDTTIQKNSEKLQQVQQRATAAMKVLKWSPVRNG